jgi:UDP-glucose 4-epimerase
MRVLVTGGSGFIGSHVVDKLLAEGIEPRILDLVSSPYHSPEEVEVYLGSVTDPEVCELALADCDAVIHLAAMADVGDVTADPAAAENVNARGTFTVLSAAARAGVRRVLYGSTIWVYGECAEPAVDEETPIPAPRHFYTATKLAGELYCVSYAELCDLDCSILRFGIPYGPRARPSTALAAFTDQAAGGGPLTIAGDGKQSRRLVYVEDLAEGVLLAVRAAAPGRVYNLAGSESVTVTEMAAAVRRAVGDAEIVYVDGRRGDFPGKEVSSERARRELGWAPRTALHEGVRRYVDWRVQAEADRRKPPQATSGRPPRILILSADIGEGHDLPARAVAAELADECPDAEVTILDGLAAMGKLASRVLRDGSWLVFRRLPWLFQLQYLLIARFGPTRWLFRTLGYRLCGRGVLEVVRSHRPDAVISTYPGVTALLGELRRRGRLTVPVYSSITDLAGLQFWAHPGVDLHFVTHRESITEVERIAGEGSVRWARPPTSPSFFEPRSRAEARAALGLPAEGPVVLVSGGGWAVGDLEGAVRTALELDGVTVVCLTGRNEEALASLEKRFGPDPRVRLLGFTNEMGDFLAAADALVHSTAGLTVLEAQIRGCHAISYGFPVGHIRLNDAAYRRFGLAETARSRAELRRALERCLDRPRAPDPSFGALPSTASLVLGSRPRTDPLPAWRLRLAPTLAAAGSAMVLLGIIPFPH